ncbi:MAG: DMT family transporter [Betaproteobacteria bacterium]|nr:MAG: DMT family transporter [Betaproteobacteria bacterium]
MTNSLRGLLLGGLGVLIFSLTMPMTKIALTGGAMSPWFVWSGRTVLAALAGIVFLRLTGASLPPRKAWLPIAGATLGIVFGWPLLNTIALQTVPSSHAAVVNGILPLATAVIGATLNRERLSGGFWICAVLGTLLVCAYAWSRASGTLHTADAIMLFSVVLGGLGYACGAIATKYVSGPEVISWALILGMPATAVIAGFSAPVELGEVTVKAWLAFVYLGLMSQWIGFFYWYRGLAMGGIAKVSQVQLMQLFFTLAFSALLLGEVLEPATIGVAVLTVALIAVGRKLARK